jgi:hypothetical protein
MTRPLKTTVGRLSAVVWAILVLMEYPAIINTDKMVEPIIMNFRFAFSITYSLTPIRLRRRRNCHKDTRTQSETLGLYLS